jgi:hypothetical protein
MRQPISAGSQALDPNGQSFLRKQLLTTAIFAVVVLVGGHAVAADNKFLPPPRADGKPTAPQNVSETDQSKNLRQGADALEKRGKEALAKDPKSVKGQQDLKDAATMREKAQQAAPNWAPTRHRRTTLLAKVPASTSLI